MHISKEQLVIGLFVVLGLLVALGCWTCSIDIFLCIEGSMAVGFVSMGVAHRKHPLDEYKMAMGLGFAGVLCMWAMQLAVYGTLNFFL